MGFKEPGRSLGCAAMFPFVRYAWDGMDLQPGRAKGDGEVAFWLRARTLYSVCRTAPQWLHWAVSKLGVCLTTGDSVSKNWIPIWPESWS